MARVGLDTAENESNVGKRFDKFRSNWPTSGNFVKIAMEVRAACEAQLVAGAAAGVWGAAALRAARHEAE